LLQTEKMNLMTLVPFVVYLAMRWSMTNEMKIVYPTSKEFESYVAHKGPSNTWTPQYTHHTPNSTHDIQWETTHLQAHKGIASVISP
jgi:hypothetical protein